MKSLLGRGYVWALVAALVLAGTGLDATATQITFSETLSSETGFNGLTNSFFVSSDGEYRVESFYLSGAGHFHNASGIEENHNNAAGLFLINAANPLASLQGIRITRLDNVAFDLVAMDLWGEVAIGQLTNFTTGAGTWTLFSDLTGTSSDPATINLSGVFSNVTQIFLADPFAAGSTFGHFGAFDFRNPSSWDNVVLGKHGEPVPEPGTLGLMVVGAAALVRYRRRR